MTDKSENVHNGADESAAADVTEADKSGHKSVSTARSVLPSVGVVGGTGPAGSALAARLASVGIQVVLGSRSKYRAMEIVDGVLEKWPDFDLPITAGDNDEAAGADLVVIATPWAAAAITARSVADRVKGKVVITMANALTRVGDEFIPLIPPRGSVAASVQSMVPDSLVAAAFQHVPAHELGDLSRPIDSDVLICSDHRSAVDAVTELVRHIPNFRALDCGELSNATAIEAFTAVLLQLNVRYKTRVELNLLGIPDSI
ncbi:MAG: NADPH-dependent F420 reductase [Actinomycetia bacterium]|nr:NADPH-dependent F420 reductase [Actinomycetes bacterium]MCP4958369.1 NADPH-dependent F420 reductase [Actinomycetes bacterium]